MADMKSRGGQKKIGDRPGKSEEHRTTHGTAEQRRPERPEHHKHEDTNRSRGGGLGRIRG